MPTGTFWGKWFLLALATGVAAGLAAILFHVAIEWVERFSSQLIVWLSGDPRAADLRHEELPSREIWLVIPVLAVGGLATGLLVFRLAPEAEGSGADAAIDAFHNQRGNIRWPAPFVKLAASALTIGTGGSAGREGPIAYVCAGLASGLGRLLKLSTHDRRILLAIGMGAGVGAIFRAPLAGAIFASEILYREADLESEVIVPGALASVVAYSVFQLSLPRSEWFTPLFGHLAGFEVGHVAELVPFTVLALVLVAVGIIYVTLFRFVSSRCVALPVPRYLRPMAGAILAGLVAVGICLATRNSTTLATLGSGYGFLQVVLSDSGPLTVGLLLAIGLGKVLTTSFTVGSGGSGGVFAPSLVIGGCLGAATGKIFHQLMPGVVAQPGAFAIVGMAGFFAGVANAPFSTILMVAEITGSYRLLLPTLWVSSICFILCRHWSLYARQVGSRLESPAHLGDFTVDLLAGLRVSDAWRKTGEGIVFHEEDSLDEIVHSLAKSPQRYFHVYNSAEELVGVFSSEDVRRYLYDDVLWKIANAGDVMTEQVVTLQPDDDLNHALGQFTALNVDELPVVSSEDPHQVLGVLRRKETIALYNMQRLELQKQKEAETGKQGGAS
jgi:CIC family chloride channel protein